VSAFSYTFEKCGGCHLFVEPNDVHEDMEGIAPYIHLHRGDRHDEALEETHEAVPSGEKHKLTYWAEHGPNAMKARFNPRTH
jgi:hypothetical protein